MKLPNKQEIDNLTKFLPVLYADRFVPAEWKGGKSKGKIVEMPYPIYNEEVISFFNKVSAECWFDCEYTINLEQAMWKPKFIKQANLSQIKTLLTSCVRGERFCEGRWASAIETNIIRLILERLQKIRSDL